MNDLRGPDWRATSSAAPARRGPHPLLALAGVCAVATVMIGLLFWLRPVKPAAVFVVSVSKHTDGSPVPFADADFARISTGANFHLPADPTRDQLRTALAALTRHPADQPLVVFLTGAATVSGGQVELAAGVPGADHGRNRVTLTDVLEQVRAVASPHKLVVFDLRTADTDWVPAAEKTLGNVPDAKRLVLFARGPGERQHASDGAVFVRYWAEGVRGAADGWNPDGNRDSRVSVNEVATFVRSRTARWSAENRATPQTPWLSGDGADFVLGAVTAPVTDEPESPADLSKLLEAWAIQDAWLADGRADRAPTEFARLQQALRAMDRDWLAGQSPDAARRSFDATFVAIERDAATTLSPAVPEVLRSSPAPDAALVEQLRRYLVRNEAVPDPPMEKPPAVTPPVILAVASADPPPTALQLKRLAKLLTEVEPEPASLPSLMLRRLSAEPVAPDRTARLLRDTLEFEQLARRVEFFAWGKVGLEQAFTRWASAVAFTCSPTHAAPTDADRELEELEKALQSLAFTADTYRAAVAALRRGERVLAKSDALDRLRASLVPVQPADPNRWATLAAEVDAAVRAATAPYQPGELAAVRRKAEASDAGPQALAELDRVLAFPLLSAKERGEVWAARIALTKKLDDTTTDRDRRDDDDFTSGRRSPEWADPRQPPVPRPWVPVTTEVRPVVTALASPVAEFLAWHAGQFDYLARNPLHLPNPAADGVFATAALDQVRRFGGTAPAAPRLEIQADGVALTPAKRFATVAVSVRLLGAEKPITTAVDVLTPSAEWVTTPTADPVELSPVRAVIAERTVAVGPKPDQHPTLRGVLVRCVVGGRAYFRRVEVNTGSLSNRLELLVSTTPDGPPLPATALRVRPNGQPAKFGVFLSNPTAAQQIVIVQLASPVREAALTLEPGERKLIAFPPPAAPTPAPTTPPASPAPAAPPSEYSPAPAEFVLTVLDGKTRDVRQTFTLPVKVTEPADLLDVREVLYSPGGELSATVGERQAFGGGDMPVSLAFPEDRNRGLTVPDGKLSGIFKPGGGTLKLYAKSLKFEPTAGRTVTLAVAADGVERAFTFAGQAATDSTVRFQPLTAARVQIRAEEFATGLAPLPIKIEADNAPPTSTVEVSVGTDAGDTFAADFTQRDIPAKDRTLGVALDPKGGFTLKATMTDPAPQLAINKLVGKRVLLARLLDANGKELARDRRAIVFDHRRPQGVRFVEPPSKVPADKPLTLTAMCDLPVSGVKEVHFFVGKPVNDAPPPNAALIAAKPVEGRNEWTAAIPLDGAKVPLDVSVQFKSKADLVGFDTITVERLDAAELNKPAPAMIKGTVLEGTLVQPGLTVVLFDDKGKEKAKAATKADGTFAFTDLPAGKYTLFVEKTSTGRVKRLPVEVKAGEEKAVELGLLLK